MFSSRKLLLTLLLLVGCVSRSVADPTNTSPGGTGAGCNAASQCTPAGANSWWTSNSAQTTVWNANGYNAIDEPSSVICIDDPTLNQNAFIMGGSGASFQPQIAMENLTTNVVVGPNSVGPTVGSTHPTPSCIPLGNGYVAAYTSGTIGNEACGNPSTGGNGTTGNCPDLWIGNTMTSGCTGTALQDICNSGSERPISLFASASGGPMSNAYGTVENYFGKNYCMFGGQDQYNGSMGAYNGAWVYTVIQCTMPGTLLQDVGIPGGSPGTYDVLGGSISGTTAVNGMQTPALPGHDDNVHRINITADSCTTTCAAGALSIPLPATGSFTACTAVSPSFAHNTDIVHDVATLVTQFNTGTGNFTGCGTYTGKYTAKVVGAATNECSNANQCIDILLNTGNPTTLTAPSVATCSAPFTCSLNSVHVSWLASNHTPYQFCRGPMSINRNLFVLCTNNFAVSYISNAVAAAQGSGNNYTIYRSPGRGISAGNCTVTAGSDKFCWCDVSYTACTNTSGVDPTTLGTANGTNDVLGGGEGGSCTVGTWPTCAGGVPKVCTTDTSCTQQAPYFVLNPSSGNDVTNRAKWSYDFAEGAVQAGSACTTAQEPAVNMADLTINPSDGQLYFVFEACDTTGSAFHFYLAQLNQTTPGTNWIIDMGSVGALANVTPAIMSNAAGHLHVWAISFDGGAWPSPTCGTSGICAMEYSFSGYPLSASSTASRVKVWNPSTGGTGNTTANPCGRSKRDEPNGQLVYFACRLNSTGTNTTTTIVTQGFVDNT